MAKGYHHVTREIRCQIHSLKTSGWSLRKIAKELGYDVSSISREIKRNKGRRSYCFKEADTKSKKRRSRASRRPKKITYYLEHRIKKKLFLDWSPEQISGRLREEGISISHESIYRFVWKEKQMGGNLYKHLRHHGKKYNKRSSWKAGRGFIPGRIDISERPQIVEEKSRIGDFEGDTIIGGKCQGAILSYVDRCSKFVLLKKIPSREASVVFQATVKKLHQLPCKIWTMTFDNGKEFARHKEIARALKTSCYFAKPYHAWERGLNEHTNGLVRQYLPKSTCLKEIDEGYITEIEKKLNHRPRKVLGYRTPYEVFFNN